MGRERAAAYLRTNPEGELPRSGKQCDLAGRECFDLPHHEGHRVGVGVVV